MKYTLLGYVPTAVIVNRTEKDGRSWVNYANNERESEFWVGTAQLYDTVEECVKGNRQTILNGIKQYQFEVKQKEQQLEAMRKLILDA